MPNLLKIPTWADEEHVYAVVETPRGSTAKLDFDPAMRVFIPSYFVNQAAGLMTYAFVTTVKAIISDCSER